jgi:hypothetical protein
MPDLAGDAAGSRFLKEPFDYAHQARVEANERITEIQFNVMDRRLERIEEMIEGVEKRLWATIYGVVAVMLTEAVQSILSFGPG